MDPIYNRDGIQLFCGDNCETMLKMEPASVDLVVTSPPYDDLRTYGGHSWDFEGVAQGLWRVVKTGGVVVWVVADATVNGSETGTSFRQALRFMEIGFRLHDTMIFKKAAVGACGSNFSYWQQFEYCFVFSSGRPKSINRIADVKNRTAGLLQKRSPKTEQMASRTNRDVAISELGVRGNVWEYHVGICGNDDRHDHPAPFPEALARDHILSWSNEGDIVLDPFSGSGTTIKMARETGRRGIGIEINQDYCEIAMKRLEQRILFGVEPELIGAAQ